MNEWLLWGMAARCFRLLGFPGLYMYIYIHTPYILFHTIHCIPYSIYHLLWMCRLALSRIGISLPLLLLRLDAVFGLLAPLSKHGTWNAWPK